MFFVDECFHKIQIEKREAFGRDWKGRRCKFLAIHIADIVEPVGILALLTIVAKANPKYRYS